MTSNKTKINLEDEINKDVSNSISNVKKKIKFLLEKNNIHSLELNKVSEHNDGNAYIRLTLEKINDYCVPRTDFYFYQEELQVKDLTQVLSLIKDEKHAQQIYQVCVDESLDKANQETKDFFEQCENFEFSCEISPIIHFSALCFLNNFHPKDILGFLDFIYSLPEIYLDDYIVTY